MRSIVKIRLLPLGKELLLERGADLQDALFAHGVEFPCGGRGLCKGCRVKVLQGSIEPSPEDRRKLSAADLADGWRLACRARVAEDLTLDLAQWDAPVLADYSTFQFTPAAGLGVAVDIGTTTLVAQLTDLQTGQVLAVDTALNPQAKHGADIMTRVEYAQTPEGRETLEQMIRQQVGDMILRVLQACSQPRPELVRVVLVGNTVMHHLFCGISTEPLSHYPFEPLEPGPKTYTPAALGWALASQPTITFLPCLGGFVGSDILAGILATGMHQTDELTALVDLGTNGEIVVGNRNRLLCTSTAAGPAFEGARISMGMRAATGAISEVHYDGQILHCHVLGGGEPRGICGSGLVDAAATALDEGWINSRGRITRGDALELKPPVSLTQWDIRELQLAKGAIAAGLRLLVEQWGARIGEIKRVYLAGAFGNYIRLQSARRIGLLELPPELVLPSGNTALLGAKLALFDPDPHGAEYAALLDRIRHVSLKEDPQFQEGYVEAMSFPGADEK